jgi:TonB family protein
MERFNPRVGHLGSAALHLVIVIALINRPRPVPTPESTVPKEVSAPRARVFLPPPEVLRELTRPPATRAVVPAPTPPPPLPPIAKDTVRVGSGQRVTGPVPLQVDRPLGTRQGGPAQPAESATPTPPSAPPKAVALAPAARPPVGAGDLPLAPPVPDPSREQPSITSSLRRLEERVARAGTQPSGATGQDIGGLFFDPQGADFTEWTNHFTREIDRNWLVPLAVLLAGKVETVLRFTVQRDGSVTAVGLLKSSGIPALDRAARNALLSGRFRTLPADYAPPSVTIEITFIYWGPKAS